MKTKLICLLWIVMLTAACSRSSAQRGDPKQYETVNEGSASGVTSTIHGPGETLPPITGTNADHTTAFAFDPNAPPAGSTMTPSTMQPPGTMVGTLPPTTPTPTTSTPIPRPQPIPQQPPPQQRPVTPPPQPPPVDTQPPPQPPPTDTTATQPPPTDTAAEPEPEPEPEPPPPTNTDTSASSTQPPPPPPPAA